MYWNKDNIPEFNIGFPSLDAYGKTEEAKQIMIDELNKILPEGPTKFVEDFKQLVGPEQFFKFQECISKAIRIMREGYANKN